MLTLWEKIRDEVDAKKDEMDMKTWRIEVFNKGIWKNGYLITLARRGWPDEIPINPTVKSLLFLISAAGSVATSHGIFELSEKITDRITQPLNDDLDKIFFKEPTRRMYKDVKFFESIIQDGKNFDQYVINIKRVKGKTTYVYSFVSEWQRNGGAWISQRGVIIIKFKKDGKDWVPLHAIEAKHVEIDPVYGKVKIQMYDSNTLEWNLSSDNSLVSPFISRTTNVNRTGQ